ncbi:hypothetical protein [Jiella sp. M17.18]|uniref:hypothetical protein n=1 Tax=Jiella sp. M17.18 TaxID=3234247 RepID=UPI0034DE5725
MIATALTFVFGFFAALLITLLVAPFVWRRAQRLAYREYAATIPANVKEIRASIDYVRAETALAARQREMKAEEDSRRAALERAEAGRVSAENAELRARNRTLSDTVEQQTADLGDLATAVEVREREIDELDEALRDTRHDLELRTEEMDALAARFRDLTAIAEERKLTIVRLEARIEQLSDDLRAEERQGRERQNAADRLRSEMAALEAQLQKEKAHAGRLDDRVTRLTSDLADRDEQIARLLGTRRSDTAATASPVEAHAAAEPVDAEPDRRASASRRRDVAAEGLGNADDASADAASSAERETLRTHLAEQLDLPERPELDEALDEEGLRQTVGDLAARVIALTAAAEGSRSPLHTILGAEDGAASRKGDPPSLAERVRRIQQRATVRDHAAE